MSNHKNTGILISEPRDETVELKVADYQPDRYPLKLKITYKNVLCLVGAAAVGSGGGLGPDTPVTRYTLNTNTV